MRTEAFSLVETALQAGVAACFANPGTTELPVGAALDRGAGIRVVPGPFEPGPGPRAGGLYARNANIANEAATTGST
jgi:acetolactate synthase-1/2/3 large subunit